MFCVLPRASVGLVLLPASVGTLLLTHNLEFNRSIPSGAVGHGYLDQPWDLEGLELSGLVPESLLVSE